MNWTPSLSWDTESDHQRRKSSKPPNRKLVEVITCPTCGEISEIRRHSVVGLVSHWICQAGKGCDNWKETAVTGGKGRGHLA